MDPVTTTFYGAICGFLAMLAPQRGGRAMRFVIGVVVGVVAATALPIVRRTFGL